MSIREDKPLASVSVGLPLSDASVPGGQSQARGLQDGESQDDPEC